MKHFNILPILLKDGYKAGHPFQYPNDTKFIYSNFTPRKSRTGFNKVLNFGIQYFATEYLVRRFNDHFFNANRSFVLNRYKRRMDNYLGKGAIPADHIADLRDLGYLPLKVKAMPEGMLVPTNVPLVTVVNTHEHFFWLPNTLETLMSAVLWLPSNSATTGFRFRLNFERYSAKTGISNEFVPWQGHDFSFRGMGGLEAALLSGAAHLLSFTGTDTIPAIDFLEEYYGANSDEELIGGSVPATEHSVMCIGEPDGEFDTFHRLITEVYPGSPDKPFQIISIVSDTWDFWKVVTEYIPRLKETILARNGKVVLRPDSGDPVKILCGDSESNIEHVRKGLIECLWDIFGGTTNDSGYRTLDCHIGAIYGDSINLERQVQILQQLADKKFAANNVVLGIGSFTYQYNTRDTYGFAMKATNAIRESRGSVPIFKEPKTDDGTKNSHRGLLKVERDASGQIVCRQNVTPEEENDGLLQTVFLNGVQKLDTLKNIRARVEKELQKELNETSPA